MEEVDRAPPAPAKNVRERVEGSAVNNLSPEKKKRLFAALGEDFFVFPIHRSTFRVISLKEDGDHTSYTVSVFDQPICECGDYVFRCIGTDQWCKHIFRVWAEIHVNELPPLGIEPEKWLRYRLEPLLFSLIRSSDQQDTRRAEKVRDAYKSLEENPSEYELWEATSIWRRYRREEPTP